MYWQRYESALKQAKCVTVEFSIAGAGEHVPTLISFLNLLELINTRG